METRGPTDRHVRFRSFEFDLKTHELHNRGRKVAIRGHAAKVLAALLENPGEVVTRAELRKRLWPDDTFVDFEHILNNSINRLREAFSDEAAAPRYIQTLPGLGYRFIASIDQPVQTTSALPQENDVVPESTDPKAISEMPGRQNVDQPASEDIRQPSLGSFWKKRTGWITVIVLAAACLATPVAITAIYKRTRRDRMLADIHAIAVLPLANVSGDSSEEYLTDGLTEELISDLGRSTLVPVISLTSVMRYKNRQDSLPALAHELSVDAAVEGNFQHAQNHFRISARLIAAPSETQLWSAAYEGNMSEFPEMVARIATDLGAVLGRPAPNQSLRSRAQPVSIDAYEQYLRGQLLWDSGQAQAALRHFQQAVALQPSYAAAYGGIAKAYCRMAIQQLIPPAEANPAASAAAEKALSLDPHNSDAHVALAYLFTERDWDFDRAEREFRTVIAEDPGSNVGHQWYSYDLHCKGRHREALVQARLAVQADPGSIICLRSYGEELLDNGKYDEAITMFFDVLEFDSKDDAAHSDLIEAYEKKGKFDLAAIEFDKRLRLHGYPDIAERFHRQLPQMGYEKAANIAARESTLRDLDQLKKKAARGEYVSASAFAYTYAQLRDRENTLKWLETAYATDSHVMVELRESDFDFIREDPRFKSIWDKVPFAH